MAYIELMTSVVCSFTGCNPKFYTMLCTLIKSFFSFRKHNTSVRSLCNLEDETITHLFVHCSKQLWCTVTDYIKRNLHIPIPLPQSAIFDFLEADDKVFLTLNHLLLLFKYYVYVSRSSKVLSFEAFLNSIMKV